MMKRYTKKDFVGLAYISPWIIGFLVFQLYPFVVTFFYSFTEYSILKTPRFNGIDNFIYMFTKDRLFWNSLKVTFIYVITSVPMKIAFALFVAMILNMKLKGVNFFRTIYYLPSILGGSVAVSVLWRFLFMKDGVVNKALGALHLGSVDWLGSPKISIFTVGLLSVWQFGSSMLLFLASLKQIPSELYEAARVDGASKVRTFFSVTLPMISPILLFNIMMQMINAFQEFTGPYVITNGGPMNSTYIFGMHIYANAFQYFKMGYASSLSWFQFIIILIFTVILFKTSKYWTYYEDGGSAL